MLLLAMPALAAFNYGIAVGGAGSVSPCGRPPVGEGFFRGSPSASAFVGARWKRSEWFIGLSTAWGLGYSCGHLHFAPFLVLQTGYLTDVGELRLGGYIGIGTSWYLGGGFHIERPFVVGPVELAPALRVSYNWPITIESHVLVRVTPSGVRRRREPSEVP